MSDPISASTGIVVSIEALAALGGVLASIVGVYIAIVRRVTANESTMMQMGRDIASVAERVTAIETAASGVTVLASTVERLDAENHKLRKEVDRLHIAEARRTGREEASGVRDVPRRSSQRPGDSTGPHR